MKNSQQPGAAFLALLDQRYRCFAILRIERSGGLIEKHDGVIRNESPSKVNPLLFAAGKSRGRQAPEPWRNMQPLEHLRCLLAGDISPHPAPQQRFGDDLKRRDARNHTQELGYVAERLATQKEDFAGRRGGNIHHAAIVAHVDGARLKQIIPEYQSEQRTFSAT